MGKKIAGVDVLLKVTDEATGELEVLGGQTSATLNREAETMDTTDKTSKGFKSSMAGMISWSIDAEGFVVLGDVALEKLEDSFLGRKEVDAEIRIGATEDSDGVTYTGKGYIVDLPLEFAQDDAVTYSVSIEGSSPLEKEKGSVTVA